MYRGDDNDDTPCVPQASPRARVPLGRQDGCLRSRHGNGPSPPPLVSLVMVRKRRMVPWQHWGGLVVVPPKGWRWGEPGWLDRQEMPVGPGTPRTP